jgi:predicted nucleic acid-binding protein
MTIDHNTLLFFDASCLIAAALQAHAPFLLALDKGLVLEINKANLGIQALTPGDFIRTILPYHVDYPHEKD